MEESLKGGTKSRFGIVDDGDDLVSRKGTRIGIGKSSTGFSAWMEIMCYNIHIHIFEDILWNQT